ncbi:hypothetical protein OSTOST_00349, partial [Ostertagia ostertagi]
MREASSISCPPCSNGFQCDTNTGVCRAFRFPGNYDQVVLMREASSISCPPCSNGFQCDTNTGVCRAFRFPGNYDQVKNERAPMKHFFSLQHRCAPKLHAQQGTCVTTTLEHAENLGNHSISTVVFTSSG